MQKNGAARRPRFADSHEFEVSGLPMFEKPGTGSSGEGAPRFRRGQFRELGKMALGRGNEEAFKSGNWNVDGWFAGGEVCCRR